MTKIGCLIPNSTATRLDTHTVGRPERIERFLPCPVQTRRGTEKSCGSPVNRCRGGGLHRPRWRVFFSFLGRVLFILTAIAQRSAHKNPSTSILLVKGATIAHDGLQPPVLRKRLFPSPSAAMKDCRRIGQTSPLSKRCHRARHTHTTHWQADHAPRLDQRAHAISHGGC